MQKEKQEINLRKYITVPLVGSFIFIGLDYFLIKNIYTSGGLDLIGSNFIILIFFIIITFLLNIISLLRTYKLLCVEKRNRNVSYLKKILFFNMILFLFFVYIIWLFILRFGDYSLYMILTIIQNKFFLYNIFK